MWRKDKSAFDTFLYMLVFIAKYSTRRFIMLNAIKKLFGLHKEEKAAPVAEAPYKVEAPSPVAEQATEAVVTSIVPAAAEKTAKKGKAPAAKKPRGPRKPKAPKAPKA